MTWKVQTLMDEARNPGGGILVPEEPLPSKGIVDFGVGTCTRTGPLTGTINGPCSDTRKAWLTWVKQGGGSTIVAGLSFSSGDTKLICPTYFMLPNTYSVLFGFTKVTNGTQRVFAISFINSKQIFGGLPWMIQQAGVWGPLGSSRIYSTYQASNPINQKSCYTVPYDGGFLTFLPVTEPIS